MAGTTRLLLMVLGPQDRGPSRQCSGSGRVKGRDFPPLSEAPVSSMTSPPALSKADTFRNSPGSLPTTTPAQGTSYRRLSPHQPCKVTSSSFYRFYIEENGEFRPCPNHSSVVGPGHCPSSLPCSILVLLRPVPCPRPPDGFPVYRSTWWQLLLHHPTPPPHQTSMRLFSAPCPGHGPSLTSADAHSQHIAGSSWRVSGEGLPP